jgi:protein involved in polysaccharide export with SLBB domain
VKVAGFTPPQVEKIIQDKLVASKVFTTPSVNLNANPNSRSVIIGGGVRVPQRIIWSPDLTAFAAIQLAGGVDGFGSLKNLKLTREGKVTVFDGRKFENDPSSDPKLLPGDLIYVRP